MSRQPPSEVHEPMQFGPPRDRAGAGREAARPVS